MIRNATRTGAAAVESTRRSAPSTYSRTRHVPFSSRITSWIPITFGCWSRERRRPSRSKAAASEGLRAACGSRRFSATEPRGPFALQTSAIPPVPRSVSSRYRATAIPFIIAPPTLCR